MGPLPVPRLEKDSNGALSMTKYGNEVREEFMLFPTLLLLNPASDFRDRLCRLRSKAHAIFYR